MKLTNHHMDVLLLMTRFAMPVLFKARAKDLVIFVWTIDRE